MRFAPRFVEPSLCQPEGGHLGIKKPKGVQTPSGWQLPDPKPKNWHCCKNCGQVFNWRGSGTMFTECKTCHSPYVFFISGKHYYKARVMKKFQWVECVYCKNEIPQIGSFSACYPCRKSFKRCFGCNRMVDAESDYNLSCERFDSFVQRYRKSMYSRPEFPSESGYSPQFPSHIAMTCDECSKATKDRSITSGIRSRLSKLTGLPYKNVPEELIALGRTIRDMNLAIKETKQNDDTKNTDRTETGAA